MMQRLKRPVRLGAVLTVAAVFAGSLAGCRPVTEDVASYDVTEPVTALDLTGQQGSVRITTGPGAVSVREVARYTDGAPTRRHSVEAGTLRLTQDGCRNGLSLGECGVRWEVRVPAGTAVRIHLEVGDVEVRDLAGDVDVETDVGDVTATGLQSRETDVRVDVGDLQLRYTAAPKVVKARSDTGDIEVYVPDTVTYAVRHDTSVGGTDVRVRRDTASANTITVGTSVGDLVVGTA